MSAISCFFSPFSPSLLVSFLTIFYPGVYVVPLSLLLVTAASVMLCQSGSTKQIKTLVESVLFITVSTNTMPFPRLS